MGREDNNPLRTLIFVRIPFLPLSLVLTEALSALTALSALASAINAIMSTCFNSAHDALNAFSAVPELSKLFDNF